MTCWDFASVPYNNYIFGGLLIFVVGVKPSQAPPDLHLWVHVLRQEQSLCATGSESADVARAMEDVVPNLGTTTCAQYRRRHHRLYAAAYIRIPFRSTACEEKKSPCRAQSDADSRLIRRRRPCAHIASCFARVILPARNWSTAGARRRLVFTVALVLYEWETNTYVIFFPPYRKKKRARFSPVFFCFWFFALSPVIPPEAPALFATLARFSLDNR